MQQLKFIVLKGVYSLCRLEAKESIPSWIYDSEFYSVSKSPDELSVVCESKLVPQNVRKSDSWKILKIDEVLDLSLTGITAKFSKALAEANINLCVIATFDTDYLMVQEDKLSLALTALLNGGFIVE